MNAIDDYSFKSMKTDQVKAGILAGHKHITKLSDILSSVPELFVALTDAKRVLRLAKELVHVMMQKNDLS